MVKCLYCKNSKPKKPMINHGFCGCDTVPDHHFLSVVFERECKQYTQVDSAKSKQREVWLDQIRGKNGT